MPTHNFTHTNSLIGAGLSESEALTYEALLRFGPLSANAVSRMTTIKRTLTYKILNDLMSKNLAIKDESRPIIRFSALEPLALIDQAQEKLAENEKRLADISKSVVNIMTEFNIESQKPNVRFFSGVAGLKQVYKEILDLGQNIKIISSPFTLDDPELGKMVTDQIRSQVRAKISARIISTHILHSAEQIEKDRANLVERKRMKSEQPNPAQVILYGNTVGITTLKEPTITTIIESEHISKMFTMLFEQLWSTLP